jgi:cytosine/adenosine deaminase-related metal-dependent hydrolase
LGSSPAGICEGANADIVSLDASHPTLAGRKGDSLLDSWIFAGGEVDCVWRRGQKRVSGGKHVQREPIRHRYARAMMGLLA